MYTITSRICVLSLLVTGALYAQNNRSAVSVIGSDANACTTIAPCRSFTVALAHTNPGGEVIAIDSGGYGAFTISQSVSVIGAPGVHAALTVTGGDGIDVAAGSGDYVKIRGLNITLTSSMGRGIYATTFAYLTIENCSVNGGHDGIFISGDPGGSTTIVDTSVRALANVGYYILSRASLVRSRAETCGNVGLYVSNAGTTNGLASAVDFVSVSNSYGAAVFSTGTAYLNLDHAMISNNWNGGITAYSNISSIGYVILTNSMITNNGGFGLSPTAFSVIYSLKNNLVFGNTGGDVNGTTTPLTAQ
jgi:hypothetical protein